MNFENKWHIINKLGEGGQGKVYRALDASKFNIEGDLLPAIINSIQAFLRIKDEESKRQHFESFRNVVVNLVRMEDPLNHGALKVLHEPKDARDYERAKTRIKREIEAMSTIYHSNLLRILDYDPDAKWFVSEFHPKGTLIDNKNKFTGNFVDALRAFRPLVEGVSKLHDNDIVHRDIKPQNVFLDSNDNLVLGDFGLVFFTDAQHTRISGTLENVGSRDWMPAWAMRMRIEGIKPTFDVFSLGKLLWAMVSRTPFLRLWYFDQPEFNLEQMFPHAPSINLANELFKRCIVENEGDCLPDATALLKEVDIMLSIIDKNADLIAQNVERPCKVCGIGNYKLIIDKNKEKIYNFGFDPQSNQSFKIFTCDYCGNVQLFAFGDKEPPAWSV